MTYVYIVKAGDFLKIGVATDVPSRLRSISTGNPLPLSLVRTRRFATMEAARQVEKRLHHYFYASRANGEWFSVGPEEAAAMLGKIGDYAFDKPTHLSDNSIKELSPCLFFPSLTFTTKPQRSRTWKASCGNPVLCARIAVALIAPMR